MPIPDSVRATVLGRVRLLDDLERKVVMCASVIGRRFDVAVLTATAMATEAQVRAALDHACTLQVIIADQPAGESYSFRHALTRDVIYAELITAPTRPLHRRIARALERKAALGDVTLDDLAYHSWAAGDARRAIRYNELAGDRAAAVHAADDARTYYDRARGMVDVDAPAYTRLSEKLAAVGLAEHGAHR